MFTKILKGTIMNLNLREAILRLTGLLEELHLAGKANTPLFKTWAGRRDDLRGRLRCLNSGK